MPGAQERDPAETRRASAGVSPEGRGAATARAHAFACEARFRWAGAGSRMRKRLAADFPPLLEKSAAATVAWILAGRIANHPEPFFAPIAAVVALNAPLGERGTNAIRLLLGVVLGIVCGELAFTIVGGGYGTLALATFTAMGIAHALGGARVVVAQAAASSILTVVAARADIAANRLQDALIGAAVALVFSQFLFVPEPLRLLRRAQAAALREMAVGLELTAQALEGDDEGLGERASNLMRAVRDRLSDLSRMRRTSAATARRSLLWWSRHELVLAESERVARVDLLGASCLTLTRIALATTAAEGRRLAPSVRALAATIAELADAPGDVDARRKASERARTIARAIPTERALAESTLGAAGVALHMIAADIVLLAGELPEAADEAFVRER